jgi:hypothetical protein
MISRRLGRCFSALQREGREAGMGGVGSTRWNESVTRRSTDRTLRLDVRTLARQGVLQPGTARDVSWSHGASISVTVVSVNVVALDYHVTTGSRRVAQIDDVIRLVTPPCTFGGERVWWLCPGCGSRRAILYAIGGVFRCRLCHRLVYDSTRRSVA